MNFMVLPELFASRVHFTCIHSTYLLAKYQHLIQWKDNPSIMEFGYADGGTSRAALQPLLPKHYKEFIAADMSPQMVKYAIENEKLPPNGNIIEFNIGTANVPAKFEQRFDHIFSFFTMHTMNGVRQALKNIHKMLKPDGEMFHVFFERTPLDGVFNKLTKHEKWGKYRHDIMVSPYYFEKNAPDQCKQDVKDAGFSTISFRRDEFTYEFPYEEAWKENYLAVNPVIRHIPNGELEEYKKDYFEEIKNNVFVTNMDDNRYPKIKCSTFVVSAKK